MTRQRIQLWLTLFCIGLLGIFSLPVSAQDDPIPTGSEAFYEFVTTGKLLYVAPGADGTTTDIYLMESTGFGSGIEVTNISNTVGANEKDPQFLPDGRIAYLGEANPTTYPDVFGLYVVGSDGQDEVQVTPEGVNVRYITFSPDLTKVAFSAQWGSNQIKIYRSDLDGANQVTLTPGEGFQADFPNWRVNANGTEEISYIRAEGGTSQVAVLDPLTAATRQVTNTPDQKFILDTLTDNLYTMIQREDADADWEVATIDLNTGEVTQLTNNTTNDCCAVAVWSVDGTVTTDMSPAGRSPAYYLSDTEDGGRDIYSVNLDGSNPINLTANDEREYTSVTPLFSGTLLVGYNEIEGDRTAPRLGFMWNITGRESVGGYESLFLTNGSDPDVTGSISLEQLEGLAAAGLLTTVCEMQVVSPGAEIYSEPRTDAEPVQVLIGEVDFLEVNAYLPATPSRPEGWYHLTDGRWVPESHMRKPDNCPPLPTISPYLSANL